MRSVSKFKLSVSQLFGWVATGILLLAVACGGAAAPATPVPTKAPQPVAAQPAAPAAPVAAPAVPKAAPTPAPVPAAATVHPGKLTIMVGDLAAERFENILSVGAGSANYLRVMHASLLSTNDRRDMVPGIASQWGLSADGLTWTFTIRKGVRFHDGSEVTPQDVLWGLEHQFGSLAFEYGLNSHTKRIARLWDKGELSGPDKVSVTTKKPVTDWDFLVSEASGQSFGVMPKRAKVHDLQEEEAYDNNPIAAGPMRVVKKVPAYVIKYERFDDYYYQPKNGFPEDKRVNFKSLEMYLVPEVATRVAALRAGETDLAPASIPTRKQVEAGGGRLVFGPEGLFLDIQLLGCWGQQPCSDKRVRQALDYAIDKGLMRDRLFGGPEAFEVKGWDFVTPSTIGYTPALDPWPFDPNKARQLLADAGYPGGKGFGKLIINTWPSAVMPLLVESAQLAADFWKKELGLDVEVRVGDSAGVEKKQNAGELNGQILWRENDARKDAANLASTRYGDPTNYRRLHEDPELFRVVQETVNILDPAKRAEAVKTLYPRLRDETRSLGIGYVNVPWAVGPRVLTWRPYTLAEFPSALHTITLK